MPRLHRELHDWVATVRTHRDLHDWVATVVIPLTFAAALFAAFFTGKQWLTAADTEQRQLRAYVGIVPGDLTNFGDPQQQEYQFRAKNFGLTPASNFRSQYHGYEVRATKDPIMTPTANCPEGNSQQQQQQQTIFPGQEFPMHFVGVTQVSAQQFNLVRTDRQYIIVFYGKICYDDAFGIVRYMKFCFAFQGQRMTASDVLYCAQHNEAN
jgi:hypothetical protein